MVKPTCQQNTEGLDWKTGLRLAKYICYWALIKAEDMLRALKQVGGVAKEISGIVRLRWEAETLAVSARAEEVGETAVEIAAQATGPGRTALKFNYLMEYFSSRAGSVTLATASPSAPVTFSHRGTPHVVVMPMHVKD